MLHRYPFAHGDCMLWEIPGDPRHNCLGDSNMDNTKKCEGIFHCLQILLRAQWCTIISNAISFRSHRQTRQKQKHTGDPNPYKKWRERIREQNKWTKRNMTDTDMECTNFSLCFKIRSSFLAVSCAQRIKGCESERSGASCIKIRR